MAVCVASSWPADSIIATRPGSIVHGPRIWGQVFAIAQLCAFGAFLAAIYVIRRRPPRVANVLALAAVIQFLPLLAPLILSSDAWAYWEIGRIATVLEGNPYVNVAASFPLDAAHDFMAEHWTDKVTPYGPVWTAVAGAVSANAGSDPQVAAWLFRLPAAVATFAIAALLSRLSSQAAFAAAFVGWCPVFAMQFAGAGHNDAVMVLMLVAGIALARHDRVGGAGIIWALAVFVKWTPLILVPLQLLADRARHRRSILLGLLIGALLIAGLSTVTFGVHWLGATGQILQNAGSSGIGIAIWSFGWLPREAAMLPIVIFAMVYVLLLREAMYGRLRRGLTMGLFLLASPLLFPWYTIAPAALAALEDDSPAIWIAILLIFYSGVLYLGDAGTVNWLFLRPALGV